MVLTDSKGNKYWAHFRHVGHDTTLPMTVKPFSQVIIHTFHTECAVHKGECKTNERPCRTEGTLLGLARCSWRDNFNRAIGRKIAFKRAIDKLDRETRTDLWKDYLSRPGNMVNHLGQQVTPLEKPEYLNGRDKEK